MDLIPEVPDYVLDDERRVHRAESEFAWQQYESALKAAATAGLKSGPTSKPEPVDLDAHDNALRPRTFDEIVGQARVKKLLQRMVLTSERRGSVLDHILLVGPSGTGKTTFAHVIARELGSRVYQLEAPVSADTLFELSTAMQRGDILFLDEIHQQAIQERRGRSSNTQPEVLFGLMEDRTLATGSGIVPFPEITVMGATTDEGLLPDAFVNRFPIRPRLESYTVPQLAVMAINAADLLGTACGTQVATRFAQAARGIPRVVGNFVRNAAQLTTGRITDELASEVLFDLNGVTEDGLTPDMQAMLKFLHKSRRTNRAGEVRYQASVSTIATAIGKSRDVKAVQLRIEPYLIELGYVQVAHGGRLLTDTGILRTLQLERGT